MQLNDILLNANNRKKSTCKVAMSTAIQLVKIKNGEGFVCQLRIRNDVNSFKEKEKWSVAYIPNPKRLYFFYGYNAKSYKVTGHAKYSHINFTCPEILEYIESKGGVVKTNWKKDSECGFYYIDLEEN